MQAFPEYVMQLRTDVRLLRLDKDRLTRAHQTQKQNVERAEQRIKEQAQRIKELERENERLKRELEQSQKTKKRYQVALFDHGNFQQRQSGSKKPKGGQVGHRDTNREARSAPPAKEVVRLFAPVCGTCGQALARVQATRRKELIDIVVQPQVVQVLLESERQWCGQCQREVCARDARSLPFTEYGLNTLLLVMILRFQAHASLSTIGRVLEISHGLTLSKATVCTLLTQAKRYLRGRYDQLIAAVRAGAVIYADETGWLVNGQQAWMWLLANDEVTVYCAAESRGKGIAADLDGDSQALCMHDGLPSYTNALPQEKHLYCWAHVLRFAHEETALEPEDSPARQLTAELVKVYQLKQIRAVSDPASFEEQVRRGLTTLLAVQAESAAIQNIQARLRMQQEGLIRALLATPDGTNNLAERELRPMVITRRISNGSNTFGGMETSAVLASLVQTAHNTGGSVLASLHRALEQGVRDLFPHPVHPVGVDSG
jgi:transposase